MVGDSNLVKQAMQLANDGVDLLRQITGVHLEGTVLRGGERKLAQIVKSFGLRLLCLVLTCRLVEQTKVGLWRGRAQ